MEQGLGFNSDLPGGRLCVPTEKPKRIQHGTASFLAPFDICLALLRRVVFPARRFEEPIATSE
jgi:hypothetical protein